MPPQNNPYDFISGANQVSPINPLANLSNDNSMKKRAITVAIVAVVLIVVVIIVFSLISKIGKGSVMTLVKVATDQSELNNIASQGNTNATLAATQNLAATLFVTSSSDEYNYLKTISGEGIKVSAKQSTETNPTITTELTAAKTDGIFDASFAQTVANELSLYKTDLSAAYKATSSTKVKNQLDSLFTEATLLQTMANTAETQASQN